MNNIKCVVIEREKVWEGKVVPQEMSEGCVENPGATGVARRRVWGKQASS